MWLFQGLQVGYQLSKAKEICGGKGAPVDVIAMADYGRRAYYNIRKDDVVINVKGFQDDRCVLYVFRCAVYYAEQEQHDPEKLKWWYWKDKDYPEEK